MCFVWLEMVLFARSNLDEIVCYSNVHDTLRQPLTRKFNHLSITSGAFRFRLTAGCACPHIGQGMMITYFNGCQNQVGCVCMDADIGQG